MNKDIYGGRYTLGLESVFVPDKNRFYFEKVSIYPKITKEDMINLAKRAKRQKIQIA